MTDPAFQQDRYTMRQKVLSMGRKFYIEGQNGQPVAFAKGTILKLKDEFRIYRDESMTQELLFVRQEQIFDAWGSFAVYDSTTREHLGWLVRRFAASFLRDEWHLVNPQRQLVAKVMEDSLAMALLRRFIGIIPKRMHIEDPHGRTLAQLTRKFITFGTWWIDCTADPQRLLDRRLVVASAVMMEAVEQGKQ